MEGKNTAAGVAGSPKLRTVALALNGGSKSKYIVKWAMEKFVPEGNVAFKLFHVYPKISGVPTPMGNLIPLPQVRDDVAAAYKREIEWQKSEMIVQYQRFFSNKKVPAEVVLVESDDIASAISMEIAKQGIKDLVLGASSNSLFARRIKGQLLSSVISDSAPGFCTVYVVSKGKLEALRPSHVEANGNTVEYDSSACESNNSSSRYTTSTFDFTSTTSESPFASSPLEAKRLDSLPTVRFGNNNPERESTELNGLKSVNAKGVPDALSCSLRSFMSRMSDVRSITEETESWVPDRVSIQKSHSVPDQASTSRSSLVSSSEGQMNINLELEKLRIELRHIRGMYAIAQNETKDTTRRLSGLSKLRCEEAMKLREISEKEEKAKQLAKLEKEKFEAAKREAEYAKQCAQREALQRREAEVKAARDAKEGEKLKNALAGPVYQYQKFTWEEIERATSSFSEELKIGEGSHGTVYKCRLHHTTVAIKVLHSNEGTQDKQFHQELVVLSKIRHPHLLLLLGACPERGCLVYEYMENGSLEDRLFRKDHTPPIPWYDRFRIAWEVASALAFLHNSKQPIIHRDLKPANILLDRNFVSKIGDAGLCTVLNLPDPLNISTDTLSDDSSLAGTLHYIDPEYHRTGQICTKSDIYALGMVILQLLTAKPAVGIAHIVEDKIREDRLLDILDKDAGRWPDRETTEMARLGVHCVELRRSDRPGLREKILPTLERLKDAAEEARDKAVSNQEAPPSHFICPILKKMMEDPCVASDGYTYERKAIEMWLKENDTSPTTNFPLSHKNLIPSYTLLYAIMEWKSKRQPRQKGPSRRFN